MRKGAQTLREIIRKAAPIFNPKGFDGAALSDLMRATGLEKRRNLPGTSIASSSLLGKPSTTRGSRLSKQDSQARRKSPTP